MACQLSLTAYDLQFSIGVWVCVSEVLLSIMPPRKGLATARDRAHETVK
jgi:hypothetical protein